MTGHKKRARYRASPNPAPSLKTPREGSLDEKRRAGKGLVATAHS
jgi:hypothetical protein